MIATDKILLDECVTCYFNKYKIIEGSFDRSVDLVGMGATDDQVMAFAKENGYLLVTIDQKFVTRCLRNGVPVAYFVNGKAHVLTVDNVFEIQTTTKGAPIKVKVAKRKQKPSLLAKLRRRLTL